MSDKNSSTNSGIGFFRLTVAALVLTTVEILMVAAFIFFVLYK